jgi:ribosomal protein S18 acetylase RimI-like enzyme
MSWTDSMSHSVVIDILQYDKELDELLEIYVKSFKEYFRENELRSKVQQFKQAIDNAIESSMVGEIFVAKKMTTLVGFSGIIQTRHQNWYLGPLAVLPEYRRQGIGKALIKHTLEFVRQSGGGTVSLVTRWYNKSAIQFYKRCNFVIDSEYVHEGQKLVKMTLKV